MDADEANALEQELISKGKDWYGLKGPPLVAFVAERLKVASEQAERVVDREAEAKHRKEQLELDKLKLQAGASLQASTDGPPCSARQPRFEIPKFQDKQLSTVSKYLEVFEAVMKLNKYDDAVWPVSLRTAVMGSKLEPLVNITDSYDYIKKEILTTFGDTPEKLWRQLLAVRQGDESFRQYCGRVERLLKEFGTMAAQGDCDLQDTLVKFMALESCSSELRAYLVEHKLAQLSLSDFQELGVNYQEAHGRKSASIPAPSKAVLSPEPVTSAQVLHVTVDTRAVAAGLEKLPLDERRQALMTQRLCFNCLSKGHFAARCPAASQCTKCGRKHHLLLHDDTLHVKMASVAYEVDPEETILMTAAVKAVAGNVELSSRVFLDTGSQASFISSTLVDKLQPKVLGWKRVKLCGFEAAPVTCNLKVVELSLARSDGSLFPMTALVRENWKVSVDSVPQSVVDMWQERGISLCDGPDTGEVELLIGSDYTNQLIHEKVASPSGCAWRTEFGWVEWPAFPMSRENGRYSVRLLWKSDERPADNRHQAIAAAEAQLKKLSRNPEAREAYDAVLLQEYIELGAVEEEPNPQEPGYYMPHHAVIKAESTTTKTRVVFNGSAAPRGEKSLNDVLDPGPSLLPDLAGLLMRFREQPVAVQADIRKAFFMVAIDEVDRHYLRFVWPNEEGDLTTYRLTRLPFGVNCSPFILTAVLRHHLDQQLEQADEETKHALTLLRDSLYVDDCVVSLPHAEKAQEFRSLSVSSLKDIGMDLRKWKSNSNLVCPTEAEETTVLGASWDTQADTLSFPGKPLPDPPARWTKREVLKHFASIFDPLGLVSPFVIVGKILMQEMWKAELSWDAAIPSSLETRVRQWWGGARELPTLKFPRWLGMALDKVTLHLFTDASEQAYGCCIYLVCNDQCQLVFAKAKVSPLKTQTLARLELQAAFVGIRWLQFVKSQSRLEVAAAHAWSDSMTVLQWIQGQPHRWKTFVANRVSEIQTQSAKLALQWHHCPGTDNPADLPSRGATVESLASSTWSKGPAWLPTPSQWPSTPVKPTDQSVAEIKLSPVRVESPKDDWWTQMSSWARVRSYVCRLLKWKYREASRAELEAFAEEACCRIVQEECFPEELHELRQQRAVKKESRLSQHKPFLDKRGLLRAKGRLGLADIAEGAKEPVLLADHHLTTLLLRHTHVQRLHQGVEGCLAFLRRKFLIVAGRRLLRGVKEACVACRRQDASPAVEISAQLPVDRVEKQRPFAVVGVDHAGPLLVRGGSEPVKAWILLFVCATTRAVHLELVLSPGTSDFMLAYRRFVALYGQPQLIRSEWPPSSRHSDEYWGDRCCTETKWRRC